MRYVRRASALHAARASAGAAWCLALAAAVLTARHPAVLLGLGGVVAAAAVAARVPREVGRAALLALPFAVLFAVINPFVSRNGVTVFFRVGEVPPFGHVDLTVEALFYGAVFGLRLTLLLCVFTIFTAAVNPDELLRLFRRVSLRSALAASLAIRLVPVLARDGRRMAEAQRCRPGDPPRLGVLRAVTTSALDRSMDVAATLEVRGYQHARRPPRGDRPWSRHDLAFAAAAAGLLAIVIWTRAADVAPFEHFPRITGPAGGQEALVAALCAAAALLPFGDRRGIEP